MKNAPSWICTNVSGVNMIPASAPSPAARPKAITIVRSVSIPMSAAVRRLCATARTARPNAVRRSVQSSPIITTTPATNSQM